MNMKNIPLQYYEITDSTNLRAKEYIKSHEFDRMLFVANGQTEGRGRLGKSFFSPKDTGIYMSLAFKSDLPLCDTVHITTASAVAVARAIEQYISQRTEIKWVNDIYLNGKKVCGILCESLEGYIIIGVGVNVTTKDFPSDISDIATSLESDCKDALIVSIYNNLCDIADNISGYDYIDFYRERLLWKNEDIVYIENGEPHTARLVDADGNGALIIYENGVQKTLRSGEISVKKPPTQ